MYAANMGLQTQIADDIKHLSIWEDDLWFLMKNQLTVFINIRLSLLTKIKHHIYIYIYNSTLFLPDLARLQKFELFLTLGKVAYI